MKPIWKNTNIFTNTKVRLFNTNVKSVLLYGSEMWRLTKSTENKLQVFVNRCLRQLLRIRWPDQVSNQELWHQTKQKSINVCIRERKWRWIGHTLRREPTRISRQALEWNPQGKRKRGRPAMTWRRCVNAELRVIGMSWRDAKRKATDRDQWKNVVKALCSTRSEED